MDKDKQRITIAEACGITVIPCTCQADPWRDAHTLRHIPDYLNDLNAMHEAEKTLPRDLYALPPGTVYGKMTYVGFLQEVCGTKFGMHPNHRAHSATAAQRAEAFLKTLDLWIYD